MNTKTKILFIALALGASLSQAQSLGEFKPKDQKNGLNKAKDAKRIYIAGFFVNYQVYNEKEDFKKGGSMIGGGYKGSAKAELSIGLMGLENKDVQQVTDKLYSDYIAQLKAKGYEVIQADEVQKTETYSDFLRMKGGTVSKAQFPGMMATAPTGYEYFVKKMDSSGKTKSGGLLNNPTILFPKLSKELNDAIISDVQLFVMFVEDQNAFQGAGANIKVKTNLRLAGDETLVSTSTAKIKMNGQNSYVPINSAVAFYHGKVGLGSTTNFVGSLGKALEIEGVIEDKKLQSFAKSKMDVTGSSNSLYTVFNPGNNESQSTKIIEVDNKKYSDGVYMAAKKFMDHHTQAFLNGL